MQQLEFFQLLHQYYVICYYSIKNTTSILLIPKRALIPEICYNINNNKYKKHSKY